MAAARDDCREGMAAKAPALHRDRSASLSSEEGAAAGTLRKRANGAANGDHASGGAEGSRDARPEDKGYNGNGHGAVSRANGNAVPRPLDAPALSLWQQYVLANKTHPLQTKCLTTGALSLRLAARVGGPPAPSEACAVCVCVCARRGGGRWRACANLWWPQNRRADGGGKLWRPCHLEHKGKAKGHHLQEGVGMHHSTTA